MLDKKQEKSLSYKDAGVDIDTANRAKRAIGTYVKSTFTENVLTEIGGFGGLFKVPKGFEDPVLVSSADGVGTKLKIAFISSNHETVGQDLVNHCVNDILCTGAKPLFFLDYLATGKLETGIVESIIKGLAKACKENSCALIGGETAEMPDFYTEGEYDLAGTIVGILEKKKALSGDKVHEGDVLLALPSNGLHTNGYSLVRKITLELQQMKLDDYVPELESSLGEELLKIHRSYLPALQLPIANNWIKSLAHITGGGITENLPRSIPASCDALISKKTWPQLPIFPFLQKAGKVEENEMYRVFNMGVGMIAVVEEENVNRIRDHLKTINEKNFPIGKIIRGEGKIVYE